MLVISTKNLYKSYGVKEVLSNVSFNINEGDKVGLIGQNGGGKSTLLKILTKEISNDSGEIFINKHKTIGYLNQNSKLNPNLSIYENALDVFNNLIKMENRLHELELLLQKSQDENLILEYTDLMAKFNDNGGYTYKTETIKILNYLKFDNEKMHRSSKHLSGGEKKRLDLAKLLLKKPDILLLDEPTNHLDLDSIEWFENYLKNYKGTIVVVSHDRYFLDKIVTHIFELENKNILTFNSNYTKFINLKKNYVDTLLHKYNVQQKFVNRELEIIKNYRACYSKKRIKAADSREKRLNKIDLIDKPESINKIRDIKFEFFEKTGNDILLVKNLTKYYGDKKIFENINLCVTKNQKIAIIGENGIGKTTFFKILCKKIPPSSGEIIYGSGLNITYYDQEQSDLNKNKTIFEEIRDSFPHITTQVIRRHLSNFLFKNDDIHKEISLLSGGEKCRLNLLKIILSNSNVLFMDEPTNHLDIYTREILEDAIINFEGTCLIISHDRYFLNKISNIIYEFKNNSLIEYLGNYDYYISRQNLLTKEDSIKLVEDTVNSRYGKTKSKNKNKIHQKNKKEKEVIKKLSKIESEINKIEENISILQESLSLEEIYSNYEKLNEVNKEITSLKNNLSSLYEEWENLI